MESFILTCLVIFAAVGVVIAWKNAKNGGMLTLVAGIALSVFALFSAGHNHAFAMLISGGPYIIAGALFLASCKKSK
ncbi:hypothetical protein KKA01_04815 [Patescibacteria group bacterium]|nr:hypothetical protein [Patescibacteria group bacterium]